MKNKKGSQEVIWIIIGLILGLVVLGIMGYGPLKFLAKSSNTLAQKATCSAIVGEGECKASCDSDEQAYPNGLGCDKTKDRPICCISIGEKPTSTT
jgi:hypothetical protein